MSVATIKNRLGVLDCDCSHGCHCGREADAGDLVQTVLIIAVFVIAVILVMTWLVTSVLNKGADASNCIEGGSTYAGSSSAAQSACSINHASTASFQTNGGYTSRY